MGKTRDLFKKIRDTKGIFHAKIDSIKDTNKVDITGAECGKNTQKNFTKKIFKNPVNHNGMITHLEPDILESEVKWVLGVLV